MSIHHQSHHRPLNLDLQHRLAVPLPLLDLAMDPKSHLISEVEISGLALKTFDQPLIPPLARLAPLLLARARLSHLPQPTS